MNRQNRALALNFALIIFFVATICLLTGIVAYRSRTTSSAHIPGFWGRAATAPKSHIDSDEYLKLMALGYLQAHDPAPALHGVIVYHRERFFNGLNFYLSGHAPCAFLMDMEGNILHTWSYSPAMDIWPSSKDDGNMAHFWRRAHLFRNGDIIAMYSNHGLIKIDRNSNLLWSYATSKKPHHDLEIMDDGTIYVLTQERKHIRGIPENLTALEDFITILNQDGEALKHLSLFELIANSPYAGLINYQDIIRSARGWGELFHTNTLEVFDGSMEEKSHLFKKGNIMVSVLWLNTIFIIDMELEKVIWALGSGMWTRQHQPTLLENGNILIFNNIKTADSSSIMEFEPCTQKIVWEYRGSTDSPFFSQTCGSNQRLPNGNTLITETDRGRIFEVTPGKETVWEFSNPFRAGKENELIATILEGIRVSDSYCMFIEQGAAS